MGESAEGLLPADLVLSKVDRFGWPGAGLTRVRGMLRRMAIALGLN